MGTRKGAGYFPPTIVVQSSGMPRYFFHVHHAGSQRDMDGVELADDKQAWSQATRSCGEMMRDLDGDLRPGPEWRLEVTDEQGRPVFAIHFSAEWFEHSS